VNDSLNGLKIVLLRVSGKVKIIKNEGLGYEMWKLN